MPSLPVRKGRACGLFLVVAMMISSVYYLSTNMHVALAPLSWTASSPTWTKPVRYAHSSGSYGLLPPSCPSVRNATCITPDAMPLKPNPNDSRVLVLVCSARPHLRDHFRRHQADKMQLHNIEVIFFLEQRTPAFVEEALTHGDMIFLNETNRTRLAELRAQLGQPTTEMFNSPGENMLRDLESFEWALRNRDTPTWFIHSDEDQFWCVDKLRLELNRQEAFLTESQPCVHIGNYVELQGSSDVATAMNKCAVERFVEKARHLVRIGEYNGDSAGRAYRDWVDEYEDVRVVDDKQFVAYGDWRDPSMWTYPNPRVTVDNRSHDDNILMDDWQHGWVPYRDLVNDWEPIKSCICACFMSIHINDKAMSDLSELAFLSAGARGGHK